MADGSLKRLSAGSRISLSQLLRLGLFFGGSLLAISVFLLAHWAIARLSREVATTSRVLAQFCAQASFPATRDPELRFIVTRLIENIDFPIVLTDRAGVPRAWKGVGVEAALVPAESIDSLAQGLPVSPVVAGRIAHVRKQLPALDATNPPIPMSRSVNPDTLGWVHYGEPPVLDVLRGTPYVSLGGTLLLLGLGFWGLTVIRQSERRSIWVGMAKETAHQIGTPLSSLMGWNQSLRERMLRGIGGTPIAAAELAEAVNEMERDIERLRKIAERFSNVGSDPKLATGDLTRTVRDVIDDMRPRLPGGGRQVELREQLVPVPPVRHNAELLEWALENLVVNAISALDKQPAWIELTLRPVEGGRQIEITVRDNGRGMSPREQRRAFEPGYTTRRRGWGLGLALARRVVEDAHGGRIWIQSSAPGQGTTMAIRLPVAAA